MPPDAAVAQNRSQQRRREVLRAAARVFADQGYKDATLEAVGGLLNMTRPALYHYAASKDQLLMAVSEVADVELSAAIGEANEGATGAERLRRFFRRYLEIITDDFGRCFVRLDRRSLSEEVLAPITRLHIKIGEAIEAMICAGLADGSIRLCSPRSASRALFGAFNGVLNWYRPEHGRSTAEVADEFMDLMLEGLGPRP